MALRCFLFSSDEETAANLRQILASLDVEGEFCADAVTAAERITNQLFQIVIIDWDQQPEAGLLLTTARERKAAERALTLAIVSNDGDAPRALHAGANSLLRKPIIVNQARETLTTARDLLRSKQGAAANATSSASASASASSSVAVFPVIPDAATPQAGEFLPTPRLAPGGLLETEPTPPQPRDEARHAAATLRDLDPSAASVAEEEAASPAAPKHSGTRGLEWYLKTRGAAQPSAGSAAAPAPAPLPVSSTRGNPELLGSDQISSYSPPPAPAGPPSLDSRKVKAAPAVESTLRERKNEAELFAYMQGGKKSPSPAPASSFRFAKRAIVPAFVLAVLAVAAAPQAPWHPRLQALWHGGKQAVHAWLNPQPATPPPAPAAHETFTRPGDEYKLPVAEAIPDATTDPSQIEVVPAVDPTIKKPNPEATNTMDPSAIAPEGSTPPLEAPGQNPAVQNPEPQPTAARSDPFRPTADHTSQPTVSVIESPAGSHPQPSNGPIAVVTAPPKPVQPHAVSTPGAIPPSLKSQIAPSNPMIGGNKPYEAALPSIEPVEVPEAAERSLITESPSPLYPANAKGQQGTVVLQVLIARDGTVQDAKFMQGSLLFARNAIDAVKQWKFRPYTMNGRPVSVQTQLTIRFKPGQ